MFQARVGTLYLANMLTGLPTAFSLHGARVETLRFEARYTGAHTDDIYCQLRDSEGTRLQFIQCKRGLDATPGNTEFVDGLQGAWRDFLGKEGSPFDRTRDVLVLATVAPATPANRAAKRLCELSRSSLNLTDFVEKVQSKHLRCPAQANLERLQGSLKKHARRQVHRRNRLRPLATAAGRRT